MMLRKRLSITIIAGQEAVMTEEKFNPVSRRSDLILAAATLAVFICVAFLSTLGRALIYSVVFSVFLSIIQTKAKKSDWQFWIIIAVLAIIHIAVLSLIRITQLKFGLIVLPFALVDGFAMWGFINWIERRFAVSRDTNSGR
jgi:hypothetical protein